MRWTTPHIGDKRIVKRFLLLPQTIDHDARWLETVYIEQELEEVYMGEPVWFRQRWATRKEYEEYRNSQP